MAFAMVINFNIFFYVCIIITKTFVAIMSTQFSKQWPFVSIVKDQLGASSYDTRLSQPLREFKSSGRAIYVTRFYTREKVLIESRDSMQLTSKKNGQDYFVCSSKSAAAATATATVEAETDFKQADDLFNHF